jgi:long-chain acyl-CoA synthetase
MIGVLFDASMARFWGPVVTNHYQAARAELMAPGAPFAVTEVDVRGVTIKTFAAMPPTMRAVWENATAAFSDRLYLVYEDEHYTFDEIAGDVRALASYLHDQGVGSGDRVAIAMRNYPEWVTAYWAIVSLGAAAVGMNAWWTTTEMEYGLTDSAPSMLIADDERLERVMPILDELRSKHPLRLLAVRSDRALPADADRWGDVVQRAHAPATLPDAEIDPDDDACIFYTSGTTGFPKGAQLTHRGSVANIFNMAFMQYAVNVADAKAIAAGDIAAPTTVAAPPRTIVLATTPLFHVTAHNCAVQPTTMAGGCIVLMRKWDAGRALELIEREQITNMSGVPIMSREVLLHPDFAARDTSSLRSLSGGGAPVPPDLVGKIDVALKNGTPTTGYGLTETHGIITANTGRNYLSKNSSCGPIVPTLDAKLIDAEGNDLAPGNDVIGELSVKGAVVIKGYLNKPEATADAIRDGWFATGDIARIDDEGFVFIVDRAKDMVLRGGENVYCSEVEAAIYRHEAVAEAAVFGIPDERLGEDVAAAVVLRPESTLTQLELQSYLANTIAKFKIPSTVMFLDEPLPRNASGKFLKRDLRAQLLASP